MITEKLQIICVTYNRKDNVAETLKQLLAVESPVRHCDILILNNASTDGTDDAVSKYIAKYPNIRMVRNRRNIGGNANIARAMEFAEKDYLWILGDDDYYDFSNWAEVENAIEARERVIILSRYLLPDEHKFDLAWQLPQATFITGVIVSTVLYSDTVMTEVYNHIPTLFPQIIPIMNYVNDGGRMYVVDRTIVENGDRGENGRLSKDVSYTRGMDNSYTSPLTRLTSWSSGWAMACMSIKDKSLRSRVALQGMINVFESSRLKWYKSLFRQFCFGGKEYGVKVTELLSVLPMPDKVVLGLLFSFPLCYLLKIAYAVRYAKVDKR